MPWIAPAIIGGASLLGGGISSAGAKKGGSQAAAGSELAARVQLAQFQQANQDLRPFMNAGAAALPTMNALAAQTPWTQAINNAGTLFQAQQAVNPYIGAELAGAQAAMPPTGGMTESFLQQTPGYQFALSQGLKAAESAAGARGLGVSGASKKAAATFATGLADQTYQNQFANAQQTYQDWVNQAGQLANYQTNLGAQGTNWENLGLNQGNLLQGQFGRYANIAGLGENAAAMSGNQAVQAGANIGNALAAGGMAQAAGTIGGANAVNSSIQNALGAYNLYNLTQNYNPYGGLTGSLQASNTLNTYLNG